MQLERNLERNLESFGIEWLMMSTDSLT